MSLKAIWWFLVSEVLPFAYLCLVVVFKFLVYFVDFQLVILHLVDDWWWSECSWLIQWRCLVRWSTCALIVIRRYPRWLLVLIFVVNTPLFDYWPVVDGILHGTLTWSDWDLSFAFRWERFLLSIYCRRTIFVVSWRIQLTLIVLRPLAYHHLPMSRHRTSHICFAIVLLHYFEVSEYLINVFQFIFKLL